VIMDNETQAAAYSTFSNTVPVPLVKIYTCGGLRIEVLQQAADTPAQAHYGAPLDMRSARQGLGSAQTLLRMLISAPQHVRSMDWIRENWYQIDDPTMRISRIDNSATFLRGLLCPPFFPDEQRASLRRTLVRCVSGSPTSGNGYELGAYPLIWIDVDAIDWNVQQACRMERFGDDAFPYWERAYHLASQGIYFPEDLYSDWTESRRVSISGSLRQSIHARARLHLEHPQEQGHAEVIRMLWDYLALFPLDEDALRWLMELLGQQERFQEVAQIFLRTQRHVEKESLTLDARTVDVWNYLRTKHLSRQRMDDHPSIDRGSFSRHENTIPLLSQIAEAVTVGIVNAVEILEQKQIEGPKNGSLSLETLITRSIVASMGSVSHAPTHERGRDVRYATK
jgi:hypothetical protein